MSLFLGKIHYWLYNKILWFERIEEEIVRSFKEDDGYIDELVTHIYEQFGAPTGGKPLEETIDTANIHGWLQGKIESAELRQAALVTELLRRAPANRARLLEIFSKQGEAAARACEISADSPEEVFDALNDYILEGMPCDRVNEVVSNNDEEFVWKTTTCLHTPYWKRIGGDARDFHYMREAWIKAFVEAINDKFKYEKSGNDTHRIARQRVKAGVMP